MATLVSVGKKTLKDNNDGRSISPVISTSAGRAQSYERDAGGAGVYAPNWGTNGNTLTAKIYAASVDITAQMTSRNWSKSLPVSEGGVSLGTGVSLAIGNLDADVVVYFFEGIYTDVTTGLATPIQASITMIRNKLGSSGTWARMRGVDVIDAAVAVNKNWAHQIVDLYRGSAVDNDGLEYQWFVSPFGSGDQLDANHPLVTSGSIRFRTKAQSDGTPTPAAVTDALISTLDPSHNTPGDGAWTDFKEILIREDAVQDQELFMVKVRDTAYDATVHLAYFTVYDVSDPVDTEPVSSAGDFLPNGVGTTNFTPKVSIGARILTTEELSGCTYIRDRTFTNLSGIVAINNCSATIANGLLIATYSGAPAGVLRINGHSPLGCKVILGVTSNVSTTLSLNDDTDAQTFPLSAGVRSLVNWQVPLGGQPWLDIETSTDAILTIDYLQIGDGYYFEWTATDRNGAPQGFVDRDVTPTVRTVVADFWDGSVTLDQATSASVGQLAKVIKQDGTIKWYGVNEIVTGNVIKIGPSSIYTWATGGGWDSGQASGWKIFICNGRLTTPGVTPIVVTGDDCDYGMDVICHTYRP